MSSLCNGNNAFLFQGVGIRYKKYLEAFDDDQLEMLKSYSDIVKKELGMDLWGYISDYDRYEEFLEWVLIYTCDYVVYKTYVDLGVKPYILAGYSMGVITGMVCANSISYEDGLRLLNNIYIYPGMVDKKEEAMASLVGFDYEFVNQIIEDVYLEEYVEIASENSDYAIVISGLKTAVEKIMDIAEEKGAIKTIKLNSKNAFHSHYALEGIEVLYEFLEKINIKNAEIPIMSVFTQRVIQEKEDLKNELIINMPSQMKWKDTIIALKNNGVDNYIDVNLNNALSKISTVINLDYKFITYDEIIKK